ncbi:MAG: hypothetical protein J0G94_14585 [Sphingomonadales bacterium]|nr:hypothetical protein [Sphingomonadales bacterium]
MQASDIVNASNALLSLAPAGLPAMMLWPELPAAALRNLMSHQSDAVAFWQNRFRADLELAQELCTARTIADFYTALVDFWEETVTEYVSEASLLATGQPGEPRSLLDAWAPARGMTALQG